MLNSQNSGACWENRGLTYVSLPAGGLLTTQQQLHAWTKQVDEATLRTALNQAVAEAVDFGQDRSGRVQSLTTWLRVADSSSTEIAWSWPGKFDEGADQGWTIWQPLAGTMNAESLVLVGARTDCELHRKSSPPAAIATAWRFGRLLSGRWRLRLWLVVMTACGLGLLCLPHSLTELVWWPAVFGVLMVLFWPIAEYFRTASPETHRTPSTNKATTLAGASMLALLVIVCCGPTRSWSGGPEPFTVLLLPADETRPPMALVAPELLQRLEQKIKSGGPAPPPARAGAPSR